MTITDGNLRITDGDMSCPAAPRAFLAALIGAVVAAVMG